MTKEGIKKCIRLIMVSYPNSYKDFDENDFLSLIDVWNIQFSDRADFEVFVAINKAIANNRFAPTISDINDVLLEQHYGKFLTDEEAWEMIKKLGRCRFEDDDLKKVDNLPDYLKPAISLKLLKEIGYASNSDIPFIKKSFLDRYHIILESLKRESQSSSIVKGITKLRHKELDLLLDLGEDSHDGNKKN